MIMDSTCKCVLGDLRLWQQKGHSGQGTGGPGLDSGWIT